MHYSKWFLPKSSLFKIIGHLNWISTLFILLWGLAQGLVLMSPLNRTVDKMLELTTWVSFCRNLVLTRYEILRELLCQINFGIWKKKKHNSHNNSSSTLLIFICTLHKPSLKYNYWMLSSAEFGSLTYDYWKLVKVSLNYFLSTTS